MSGSPDRPEGFSGFLSALYNALWEEIRRLPHYTQQLEDNHDKWLEHHWLQGTRAPCINRIKGVAHRNWGDQQIADKVYQVTGVRYERTSITHLRNDGTGHIDLIRNVFGALNLTLPSKSERRISGHCHAISYIRREVWRNPKYTGLLSPKEFVPLFFAADSDRWVYGVATEKTDWQAEGALAVFQKELCWTGQPERQRMPSEYVGQLRRLYDDWRNSCLLFIPDACNMPEIEA